MRFKTAREETANSRSAKCDSAFAAISLAPSRVISFRRSAPAKAFRNSERHNSGAIQSGSLAKAFSAAPLFGEAIHR